MFDLRKSIVEQIETAGGRHDEVAIYGGEPGDPGIGGGPGSISWEINGDLASVMVGVYTQSSYRTQPLQRARNTLGYVLRTTFGNSAAATEVIERVKKIHS